MRDSKISIMILVSFLFSRIEIFWELQDNRDLLIEIIFFSSDAYKKAGAS